jgi:hypothetical protein
LLMASNQVSPVELFRSRMSDVLLPLKFSGGGTMSEAEPPRAA